MTGIAVEPHRPEDWRFVRAMLESSALATYPDLRALGRISRRERLDALFEGHWSHEDKRVWIARDADGTPAGLLWLEPGHNRVSDLPEHVIVLIAVAEPYRRQGLGTRLMALAREQGGRLRLFVAAENEAALALYARAGFRAQTIEMVSDSPCAPP